jgi:hypothetical protein
MEFLSFLGVVFLFLLATGFILGVIWVSIEWESRGHKIEFLNAKCHSLSGRLDAVETTPCSGCPVKRKGNHETWHLHGV